MIKLNLGCGPKTPDGWVNVDYWIGARLRQLPIIGLFANFFTKSNWNNDLVLQDLTKKWQWGNNSADIVYSSHTIEHMWKEDGEHFLSEAFRVLKPGGVIRVIVPDIKRFVERYLDGDFESTDFLDKLGVFPHSRDDSWYTRIIAVFLRYPHKCMYDLNAMTALMEATGFEIIQTQTADSVIEDIDVIERPDRRKNAVIVEARKPL